jgi:4-hydroxy-tetrahydrodipicolinate reductase
MRSEIKIVFFGLGPMGARIATLILEKRGIRIVGAIDIAKEFVGKDLGEILKSGKKLGVILTDNAEELLSRARPDIAVITTRPHLNEIYPQIMVCVKARVNVISTCEELSFPYSKNPKESREINEAAKKHGVAVLGTGINPGYLMDTLPITLTGACQRVESIKVTRMMNSSKRRIPYQKKIGTGLTPKEFRKMIDEKEITGHVGLYESISMIAAALGWKLDNINEFPPEPVIAERKIVTPYTTVETGNVAGLKSIAHGIKNETPAIILEFISHAAVKDEYDSISIRGVPDIFERIIRGVHGDLGTAAVVVNMIPHVLNSRPGLVTMKDLPLPHATTEDLRIYLNPQ